MIGLLVDQSHHRAARIRPRHQERAVEAAAMAFRCLMRIARYGRDFERVKGG